MEPREPAARATRLPPIPQHRSAMRSAPAKRLAACAAVSSEDACSSPGLVNSICPACVNLARAAVRRACWVSAAATRSGGNSRRSPADRPRARPSLTSCPASRSSSSRPSADSSALLTPSPPAACVSAGGQFSGTSQVTTAGARAVGWAGPPSIPPRIRPAQPPGPPQPPGRPAARPARRPAGPPPARPAARPPRRMMGVSYQLQALVTYPHLWADLVGRRARRAAARGGGGGRGEPGGGGRLGRAGRRRAGVGRASQPRPGRSA